jgi:hypothetical protein
MLKNRDHEVHFATSRVSQVKTLDGTVLSTVEDFKYLESHLEDTEKDIEVRKALAWQALHSLEVKCHQQSLNQ